MSRQRGSVRPKAGRWELRVSLGSDEETGRRLTKSKLVPAADEDDARRKLAGWLASMGDTGPQPGVPTVTDALERWYVNTSARRTTRSNDAVRSTLDGHLIPELGHLPLTEVTVQVIEQYYTRCSQAGLADGTVRHLHYALRPALRLAVRWGWIEKNPADVVDLGPLRRHQVHPPTAEDVDRLIAAAPPDLGLFLRLYAVIGARRGEIAALRWTKIDLLAGTIMIDSALTEASTGMAMKGTKTARGQRKIGIDSHTKWALEAQRVRCNANGMIDNSDAFLFPDLRRDASGRTPCTPNIWSGRFHRLKAELGLPGIRMHDLRHFFATNLLSDGIPVTAVSAALGHGRTSTTLDTYGMWASRATDHALAERVARRLRPTGSEHGGTH